MTPPILQGPGAPQPTLPSPQRADRPHAADSTPPPPADSVHLGTSPAAVEAPPSGLDLATRVLDTVTAALARIALAGPMAASHTIPPQPSDQRNEERIRWLKDEILRKQAEVARLQEERSRTDAARQAKIREKEQLQSESYSLGQQINNCNYQISPLQTELYTVQEKLRWEKDPNERWRLEARREQLNDQIYKLRDQVSNLQYKRNDVEYKIRDCDSQANELQNKYWSLGNEIDHTNTYLSQLKDELYRLEHP